MAQWAGARLPRLGKFLGPRPGGLGPGESCLSTNTMPPPRRVRGSCSRRYGRIILQTHPQRGSSKTSQMPQPNRGRVSTGKGSGPSFGGLTGPVTGSISVTVQHLGETGYHLCFMEKEMGLFLKQMIIYDTSFAQSVSP